METIILNETEEVNLSKDYIKVENSFGGNQEWSDKKQISDYGCGLIAFNDLVLYMKPGLRTKYDKKEYYLKRLEETRNSYFRFWCFRGIPGIWLSLAMKRFIRGNDLPYRVSWGVLPWNLKKRIKDMIRLYDLPVIFSIGPGYFRKNRVTFYERRGKIFNPVCHTKSHYVTVTGYIEEAGTGRLMLRISSWGNMYYIDFNEYCDYVKKNDNFYFSSILSLKKTT